MKLTPESFVNVVKKSSLIEPEQLKRLLQEFQQQGVRVDDSQEIAKALVDRGLLTIWQAEKLLKGKHRGFFLGKYRLLSLLGKGGMSSVYLAEHVLMRRRCAIKVLPQKRVDDSSYLGRFHREAQAVASLDHSNIVRAYDVDVDRNVEKNAEIHFLVMEYVDGKSLQDLVEQQAAPNEFDFVRAADYVRQAADGLAHAHQAGMVHRDIKPANLLVDESGTVRILDLGLARFFAEGEDESLTVAHDEKVLGTADYLAPEQALDSHNVDARADIYSLGCTFYCLLTGHAPFTEGTLAQRLMAHQTKEPPSVETDRPDAPPALVEIVNKMMAKNADDRWQTAAEASEVLSAWLVENGGEEWRARNPALSGTGSSIIGRSSNGVAGASGTKVADPNAAAVGTQISGNTTAVVSGSTEPVESVDDNDGDLAAFLSNLGSAETAAVDSPAAASTEDLAKPPRTAKTEKAVVSEPPAPVAVPPKASLVAVSAGSPPSATPIKAAVPVARAVTAPSAKVATAVPVAEPVANIQTNSPVVQQTAPTDTAAPRRRSANAEPWLQNPRIRIALIALAAILVIGGGTWGALSFFGQSEDVTGTNGENNGKSNGTDPSAKNGKRAVVGTGDIRVGPGRKFPTIGAAIKEAKKRYEAGDAKPLTQVISVAAGATYRERIELDNSQYEMENLKLQIIAEPGKPAILAPAGTEPIVVLTSMKDFLLRGFDLKAGTKTVAVKISQACFGTKLRKLNITGYTATGIYGLDLKGFAGKPAILEDLTLKASTATADGIKFSGEVAGLAINHCRFLGPMRSGVRFTNDPTDVRITHSVFYELGIGVDFSGSPQLRRLIVQNNTFRELQTGISIQRMPAKGSEGSVISKNVFSKITGPDATVKERNPKGQEFEEFLATDGMLGNMTDRKTPHAKDIPFFHAAGRGGRSGVEFGFASTDPKSDRFLMPATSAPQQGSGAQPGESR